MNFSGASVGLFFFINLSAVNKRIAMYSQFHSASVLFSNSLVIQVTWRYVTWPNKPIEIHAGNMEASISCQLSSDFVCLCLGKEMISFVLFTWVIQNIKFSVILSILVAWKINIKVVLRWQISLCTLLHVHPVHRQINNWWSGKHFTIERMSQNSMDLLVRSCYQMNLVINILYKTENNINLFHI